MRSVRYARDKTEPRAARQDKFVRSARYALPDERPHTEAATMSRQVISTELAPAAIGTYSQAVKSGGTIYLSGQIGLDPATKQLVEGVDAQIVRVFDNLRAVTEAAGGSLADIVKLNIYLTDLGHFSKVNETMAKYFHEPYPARAVVGVANLPRGALIEADGVMILPA